MTRIEGTLYQRTGSRAWYYDVSIGGKRVQRSTGTADRRAAAAVLAKVRRGDVEAPGGLTLRAYVETWLARRRQAEIRTVDDEAARLEHHVLPTLGDRPLDAITRDEVLALVAHLRSEVSAAPRSTKAPAKRLAPRTTLHVYRTLRAVFVAAEESELVTRNPCTLKAARKGELPKKRDASASWRTDAVYTRDELVTLISDPLIAADRRVLYALGGLAGCRFGEACARRWRDLDVEAVPLGKLTIATQASSDEGERETKTGDVRQVPVHPTLATILGEWRRVGWPALYGRVPGPEDLIVPSREVPKGATHPDGRTPRSKKSLERLREDQGRVKMRPVPAGLHSLRATFISLLEADGANAGLVRFVTHAPPSGSSGDARAGYVRPAWAHVCAEVGKLAVGLPAPVASLEAHRMAVGSRDSQRDSGDFRGTSDVKKSGVDGTRKGPPLGNVRDIRGTSGRVGDPPAPSFSGEETPRTQPVTLSRAEARAALLALAERLDAELAADVRALVARPGGRS